MLTLTQAYNIPFIIMGDFNKIKDPRERLGCEGTTRIMVEFGDRIEEIGLIDFPFFGCKYTWKCGSSFSRLDRVLMSPIWFDKYEALKLWGLKCSISNHVPRLVESNVHDWGLRPFHSLDVWFTHPVFSKLVAED